MHSSVRVGQNTGGGKCACLGYAPDVRFAGFAFLVGCSVVTISAGCRSRHDAVQAPADATGLTELPSAADVVLGVSVAQVRAQRAFDPLVNEVRARLRPAFELVQTECHFDPLALVDSVVLSNDGAARELSLALVRGRFERAQIDDCVARVASADRGKPVVARREGRLTIYAAAGEPLELHVLWLGDGLVLIPFANLTDRAYADNLLRAPRRLSQAPTIAGLVREASAGHAAAWLVAAPADAVASVAPWLHEPLAAAFGAIAARRLVISITFGGGLAVRARADFASPQDAATAAAVVRGHATRFTTFDVPATPPREPTLDIVASLDDDRLRRLIADLLALPSPRGE